MDPNYHKYLILYDNEIYALGMYYTMLHAVFEFSRLNRLDVTAPKIVVKPHFHTQDLCVWIFLPRDSRRRLF